MRLYSSSIRCSLFLSVTLPLFLFLRLSSSSSTSSSAPSQFHLCLLSSLHVFAAIFSPYLEPDIFSLLMILKRTPGRLLPDACMKPHLCTFSFSLPPLPTHQPFVFSENSFIWVLGAWHWHYYVIINRTLDRSVHRSTTDKTNLFTKEATSRWLANVSAIFSFFLVSKYIFCLLKIKYIHSLLLFSTRLLEVSALLILLCSSF